MPREELHRPSRDMKARGEGVDVLRQQAYQARVGCGLQLEALRDERARQRVGRKARRLLQPRMPLDDQLDGTLAHAIERSYYFACERAGFDWVKVARPDQFKAIRRITPVDSPEALERFVRSRLVRLTGNRPNT